MDNPCQVQVTLELGHQAQLREKPTDEGFTHDWMVFVRGPEQCDIQHFVERVVFRLHESFPKPKRVCKEPPYKVEESGYAGFIMPIEVHFKNKGEPKKVFFTYDLFLNLEGNPPVNNLRCEKLTFKNPTKEFRRKLIKAGGISNVTFFLLLPTLLYLNHQYVQQRPLTACSLSIMVLLVGAFSAYYHMMLSYVGQLLDELAILWTLALMYILWFPKCYFLAFIKNRCNLGGRHAYRFQSLPSGRFSKEVVVLV